MLQLNQVVQLSIMDSSIKGTLYLGKDSDSFIAKVDSPFADSPVFRRAVEAEAYHCARDWFLEEFDGFIQIDPSEVTENDARKFATFVCE